MQRSPNKLPQVCEYACVLNVWHTRGVWPSLWPRHTRGVCAFLLLTALKPSILCSFGRPVRPPTHPPARCESMSECVHNQWAGLLGRTASMCMKCGLEMGCGGDGLRGWHSGTSLSASTSSTLLRRLVISLQQDFMFDDAFTLDFRYTAMSIRAAVCTCVCDYDSAYPGTLVLGIGPLCGHKEAYAIMGTNMHAPLYACMHAFCMYTSMHALMRASTH